MTTDEVSLASTSGASIGERPRWLTASLIGWALGRLLLLLAVVYVLKDWILDALGDPHALTLFVINVTSTPVARMLLFLVFGLALTGWCYGIMRAWPRVGYGIAVAGAALLTLVLFHVCETSPMRALPVIALLAANLVPDRLVDRLLPNGATRDYFLALAVGVAEVFFLRQFLTWVAELWRGRRLGAWHPLLAAAAASFIAAGAASVLMQSTKLAPVEQAIRMPAEARILAQGDYNWIEMDAGARHLFVTGHGVPRLLRYDITDFARAPEAVAVDTGRAQSFTMDGRSGEIYVYNSATRELLTVDAKTLELKNSFAVAGLATGDPWLAADRQRNALVIVSEADEGDGVPFLTLDLSSGNVRDKRDLDAGNLLLVGETGRLYMSFFRRRSQLMRYDLSTLSIDKEADVPPRADRMAYVPDTNEVLLTVPAASRIVRYDAETLEQKGAFKAIFGVRTLAIDSPRRLLLCGSLATGEIAIIDLDTFEVRSRHYLGPWLRTIVVDSSRGAAYVSSKEYLYELKYDSPR